MTASVTAPSTTLRPPWLHVARAAWVLLAAAALVLFAFWVDDTLRSPPPSCAQVTAECQRALVSQEDMQMAAQMGLPTDVLIVVVLAIVVLARLVVAVAGAVIFWRRSNDWIALLTSAALLSVLIEGVASSALDLMSVTTVVVLTTGTVCFLALPFLFPNGRFEPHWIKWPAIGLSVIYTVVNIIEPTGVLANLLWLAWLPLAIGAMAYRYYRVSNPAERQQTKWVLVGILCTFMIGTVWLVGGLIYPASQPSLGRILYLAFNVVIYLVGYLGLSTCIAIAILRYRLWDIDVIINRALVYGGLTALLGAVYFGSVVILQNGVEAFTGQAAQTPLAIVASTLAIAALFAPMRRRLQNFIDRRFYRRKYNAAQTLAAFGAVARDETDLDRLAGELVDVINDTVQPATTSLWLRKQDRAGRRESQ